MAKRKQKNFVNPTIRNAPPRQPYPAISVVIPMYNVEKYVGECLESLLAQTFQDFEIIVVDDCSTDSSAAIVESYKEKFGGRLKLTRTKKNSGGCAVPRNVGFPFSRGEYVFFMDADDMITPTAFEELYSVAKDFDADVVHCEKYYNIPDEHWNNAEFRKNLNPTSYQQAKFVTEPTLLNEDISERVIKFSQRSFIHAVWVNLVRRDFLIENEIKMFDFAGEDMTFTICALCTSKKFVLVPNVVNYYRGRENSVMTEKLDADRLLRKWVKSLRVGIKHLDEFLSDRDFFLKRPDLKYILFDTFAQEMLKHLNQIYAQVPAPALDEILRKEFSDGDNLALTSFIFNTMNIYRLQLMQAQVQFNQFAAQAQQRIAELENEIRRLKS